MGGCPLDDRRLASGRHPVFLAPLPLTGMGAFDLFVEGQAAWLEKWMQASLVRKKPSALAKPV